MMFIMSFSECVSVKERANKNKDDDDCLYDNNIYRKRMIVNRDMCEKRLIIIKVNKNKSSHH